LWGLISLSLALSVPLAYVLPQSQTALESGRLGSPGLHPNDYAGLLVIAFLVVYWMLNKRFPVARYVLALPIFFGVLATQSRTGLVVLLATPLLALLAPGASKRSMRLILIVYGLAALVFMGVIYTVPSVGEHFLGRYETLSQYQNEETWAGRWDLWSAAFHIISSHPLLGVGVGNFPKVAPVYSSFAVQMNLTQGAGAASAHDAFVSVASELGPIGLALFVGILFFAFKQALELVRRGSAASTGLLFGLVAYTIMTLTTSWEFQKIGYFVLGSILALHAPRVLRNATQEVRKAEEHERQW
jgi:O-antigen ligase